MTLPIALPISNFCIPLAALIAVPLLIRFHHRLPKQLAALTHPLLRSALPYAPFLIVVLSAVYLFPSDLISCSLEQRWARLFRIKNGAAIRAIQNQLRCCGFNSLHDRAWPFPSHDVNADACVRTQGYTQRCADVWHRQQSAAAAMTLVAGLLNWVWELLALEGLVHVLTE